MQNHQIPRHTNTIKIFFHVAKKRKVFSKFNRSRVIVGIVIGFGTVEAAKNIFLKCWMSDYIV